MKRCFTGLLIAMVLACPTGKAEAADATAAVDVVSAYVWRGITFNDGLVVQPWVDVSKNGFGFNVWGNMDIDDDFDPALDSGKFSEVDLTLSYGFDLDPASVAVGVIEYLFPIEDGGSTSEVFLSLSTDLPAGFSVGLDSYYDFDEVDDYYVDAYAAYAIELENGLGLGISALAGYAGEDMSAGEDGGLHEYTFSVDAAYAVTDALGLSAFVAYTGSLDEDVLPDQDVHFYGGGGVSYSF